MPAVVVDSGGMLVDHGGEVFSAAGVLRLPGFMRMPVRMAVVRLRGGGLWVHSPIRFDEALAQEIAAQGDVRYLVAPSHLHHLFVGAWAQRFPAAKIWAPDAVRRKQPALDIAGAHGGPEDPWHDEIESIPVLGAPKGTETVFFHRASRTLFVTDLMFNIREVHGFVTGLALRMMGVHGKLAQSRVWRFLVKDRVAFAQTGQRLLALAPARLVCAHGDVIERLPAEALSTALAWMCAGATRALPGAA